MNQHLHAHGGGVVVAYEGLDDLHHLGHAGSALTPTAGVDLLCESILVAACDLDKTVYPPSGPNQTRQLKANINDANLN